MKMTDTLREAARLHKLGFAIHWLHAKSKRPIEAKWTTGPRKSWEYLKETYVKGLNIGVRLGTPSKIGDKYLATVDIDIKSKDERHKKEALAAAKKLLKGADCPAVRSGRGQGSRHYHCLTEKPFKTFTVARSTDIVKVHMPSKKPSKKEIESLSEAEIAQGIRLSPAWEISLYSDGRQVVLPPSIHPDSGQAYTWAKHVTAVESLPVLDFERETAAAPSDKSESAGVERAVLEDFAVEPVDLEWLPISDQVREGIINGTGVVDRSGYLLPAATALVSAGLTQNEVLTVLTDPKTFLGACSYDHAKTQSRAKAANWVFKYTLQKVVAERSPERVFKDAEIEDRTLTLNEAERQADEFESDGDWRQDLERTDKGKYRNTSNNCKLILQNVCGQKEVVGRNEFAANDYYLVDTPWISKKGDAVTDIDIVRIKFYCAEKFGVEFSDNVVNQSLMSIADINRFHPVRDWMRGLKWDGVERLDTWLKDYAGAEGPEPYLSDVSRKVVIAMVKRVFEPGCKFDYVMILEGPQGKGKSTFLEKLTEPWFSDAPLNIGDKDAILTMQSKLLIELGELSSVGRADLEILKAFISQKTDRIRAPYGKRIEEFPRQCIFIGTTNNEEYLRDLTGNRRFWSVKLKSDKLDFHSISKVREQLFAEALTYYQLGEPLYLDNEQAEAQSVGEQAKRLQSDEWIGAVSDVVNSENFPVAFEMREVAKRLDQFGAHKLSPSDVHRLTRCFRLLGFERFQEPTGARRKLWRAKTDEPRGTGSNHDARFDKNTNEVGDFY